MTVDLRPRQQAVQRRTLPVLALAQVLGGVGLAAAVSVGALLARDLLGGDALSGLPIAVSTTGGALAAIPLSRLMDRRGRRPGLTTGYAAGAAGALLVVLAATVSSIALLALGMLLLGAGTTSSLLARYAAADLAGPEQRGRAISLVLFATTFGAVAGPNLLEPTGRVAQQLGLPVLAGPFLLSALAYTAAAAAVTTLLRPDPLLVAREGAPAPAPGAVTSGGWHLLGSGPALVGVSAMVSAQLVMVAMMTMTPVHMTGHGHGLGLVGFVISAHIAGMYLFAPIGGLLSDRLGRPTTLRLGAALLAAAGLLGALADTSVLAITVSLFLLGVGWSLALVGGSALLTDAVPLKHRAPAQGRADLLVGLAGGAGGLGSGFLLTAAGFAGVGLATAAVAVAVAAASSRAARA